MATTPFQPGQPDATAAHKTGVWFITAILQPRADPRYKVTASAKLKQMVNALGQCAGILQLQVRKADAENEASLRDACPVCGWLHDKSFRQIGVPGNQTILLPGILPEIVALVHRTHQKGFSALSVKDEDLLKICGGYYHPCKAFDDLKRRAQYQILFDTRRRGFISLRRGLGINRNLPRNDTLISTI